MCFSKIKNLFKKPTETTDWFKYVGLELSPQQQKIQKESDKQIVENGIYTIFDKSNSKEEIIKRLNDNEDRKLKYMGIRHNRIALVTGVFIAIFGSIVKVFF